MTAILLLRFVLFGALVLSSCQGPARSPGIDSGNSLHASAVALPASVDLRQTLIDLDLPPRPQGARGTCSIFTTCSAVEFAHAKQTGRPERLSTEFMNWAAGQAAGRPSDGNFFHNALAGFERFGVCDESAMPYEQAFDTARGPSDKARAEADQIRRQSRDTLVVHWIVPWQPDRFGVSDEQFTEIKRVLTAGYPVAAGSAHSRLLVGYRDDESQPGGGVFYTEDSALNRFDEVTYDFVRTQVADVFWVEAASPRP